MIILRDYQEDCVQRVLAAYRPGGREYIVIPTGGGKTIVFSTVIHSLAREYGLSALVIAHRDELLNQAADKYHMIQPDAIIGKVGSGIREYGGQITVASIATISRPNHIKHLRALYGTGKKLIIVIDEFHHAASTSYQTVLQAFPDAFVLGVTATPDRLDKKVLLNKEPIFKTTIREMIQAGHLCPVRAIAIKTDTDLGNIKTTAGDYNQEELDLAINTPERNRRVVEGYLEHTKGERGIFFCVTIAHAEALAYQFNDMGVPAAIIEGDTPLEERARLYKAFRTGEILILTNVMVLTEGYDEPLIKVIGMTRPTQSRALYTQAIGRGLRLCPGKKQCTILDVTDNCLRLRLSAPPLRLQSVLDIQMQDGEDILEALEREEAEKQEHDAQAKRKLIRKLNERRTSDVAFDPFGLPEWQELDGNRFMLELPIQKHKIALIPCKGDNGLYEVCARLAPTFELQKWLVGQPLDYAMQHAEKKAHMLLAEPSSQKLLDRNAPWRSQPIDPESKQVKFLKWKKIPVHPGMTKGEASDLIDAWKEADKAKKTEKAARQAAKLERMEA